MIISAFCVGVIVFTSWFLFVYDADADGLSNWDEFTSDSSMFATDTDDDGLDDETEVNQYGSSPVESDTDGDGLNDAAEINTHGSDPLSIDTDGDGLDDGTEVDGWKIWGYLGSADGEYESVNVHSNPVLSDTDGDGLDDQEEWNHDTNPSKSDSDGDNLGDFEEINELETSPTNFDNDFDGLSDGEEVLQFNTDPVSWDMDNDALDDGTEVSLTRANPLARDVFIEVDWTETSQSLSADVKTKLKMVFDKAPIKNPDNSQGVNLHIDVDNQVPTNADFVKSEKLDGSLNDFYDFRDRFFTPERENTHHYALLTKFAEIGEEPFGGVALSGDFMSSTYVITTDGKQIKEVDKNIGTTFMHELGHTLGLNTSDFGGIDSESYSYEEYSSVMNYNSFRDEVTSGNYIFTVMEAYEYSSGGVFDDWAHLKKGFDPI